MARKRINKNLVAFLTISGIVLSVAVIAAITFQVSRKEPEVYATEARNLEAAGDFERGARQFQRAYNVNKEVKYLIDASRCNYQMGEIMQALTMLRMANGQRPDDRDVLTAMLERLWELSELGYGPWRDMREYSDKMLEVDGDSVLALVTKAWSLRQARGDDPADARDADAALQRAIELAPTNPRVAMVRVADEMTKASELRASAAAGGGPPDADALAKQHAERAAKVVEEALKANPGDTRLTIQYAQLMLDLGNDAACHAALKEAIEAQPDDPELLLGRGRMLLRDAVLRANDLADEEFSRKVAEAEECIRKAVAADPAQFDAYINLAQIALNGPGKPPADMTRIAPERFEAALVVYENAVRDTVGLKTPRAQASRGRRAAMVYEAFRLALGYWQAAQDAASKAKALDYARGFLQHAQGEYADAYITRAMEGDLAVSEGRATAAIQAYLRAEEKSRDTDPTINRQSRERLAFLYRETDQVGKSMEYTDLAIRQYEASNQPPTRALLFNKAELLNLLDRPQEALDMVTALEPRFPDDVQLTGIKTVALTRLGRNDEARELTRAAAAGGGDESVMMRARLAAFEKDYGTAEALLREMLAKNAEDTQALRLLIRVMSVAGRQEEARALLAELSPKITQPALQRVVQAYEVVLSETDEQRRDAKLLEIIQGIDDPKRRATELYNFWATKGEYAKAVPYLDELEQGQEENTPILEQQFYVALQLQQFDRAERYAARLAHLNADLASGATYRGRLALAQGNLERGLRELRDAERQLPPQAELKVEIARALLTLPTPRLDEAQVKLQEALQLNPRNFTANKVMFMILERLGQATDGVPYLEAASRLNPRDEYIRGWQDYLNEENNPRAGITQREQRRQEHPQDVANLIRLGELYGKVDDDVRADECFQAAAKIDPGSDELARICADFYPERGDPATGERILRDYVAAKQGAEQVRAQFYLGSFFEQRGQYAVARDTYVQADALIDQAVPDGAERRKARVRANFQLADFYSRVQLVKEMIEACRRALDNMEPTDTELAQQARLRIIEGLLSTRRYGDAEQETAAYVRDFPKDYRGLVAQAQLLLARNRREEARRVLTLVIQQEPSHVWSLLTRGSLDVEAGDYARAREELLKAKQSERATPVQKQNVRLQLANLYERLGQYELAEAELQEMLDVNPGDSGVATRLMALLRRADRRQRGQEVIGQFMARQPDAPFWPHQMGLLMMEQGEYSSAARYLKQAVDLSRGADANMLADWLHALVKAGRAGEAVQAFGPLATQRVAPLVRAAGGEAMLAAGQRDNALAQFKQALFEAAQSDLSLALLINAKVTELLTAPPATDLLRQLTAQPAPDEYTAWRLQDLLAMNQVVLEDGAAALASIETVLAQAPRGSAEHLRALLLRADALRVLGQTGEMVAAYEQVLMESPDNLQALNNLAFMLCEMDGRAKEALQYAEQARKLGEGQPSVLDTVGWVYYQNEMYRDAETVLQEAVRLSPDMLAARYHLAAVMEKQGRQVEAERMFRSVLERGNAQPDNDYVQRAQQALAELKQ